MIKIGIGWRWQILFSGWGVEGKRSERRGQEQEVQKRLERDGEMAFAERTDLHCDCGMGIKGFFFRKCS